MKITKLISLFLCFTIFLSGCLITFPVAQPEPSEAETQAVPSTAQPTDPEPTVPESLPPEVAYEPEDEEFVLIREYIPSAKN